MDPAFLFVIAVINRGIIPTIVQTPAGVGGRGNQYRRGRGRGRSGRGEESGLVRR